jgi:hypothetical protein
MKDAQLDWQQQHRAGHPGGGRDEREKECAERADRPFPGHGRSLRDGGHQPGRAVWPQVVRGATVPKVGDELRGRHDPGSASHLLLPHAPFVGRLPTPNPLCDSLREMQHAARC